MSCWATLGLEPAATHTEVERRWRELRSELHPDRGGDEERFITTERAYREALELAQAPRPCPSCDGVGYTTVTRGFNVLKVGCAACGGSGETL